MIPAVVDSIRVTLLCRQSRGQFPSVQRLCWLRDPRCCFSVHSGSEWRSLLFGSSTGSRDARRLLCISRKAIGFADEG